jgi:GntR family transcriptional regulator
MPSFSKPDHKTLTESTAIAIRSAIRQGTFTPGSQLPPEMELLQMLGVSRTTLREALRTLEEQGMIIRRRGLGTFVSERSIVKDLSINFGITEMIAQAGYTPGTLQDKIREDRASKEIAEKLALEVGEAVIVMDRIRTANNSPVVWSIDTVPARLMGSQVPGLLDLRKMSLYEYIHKNLNLRINHGVAQVSPVVATREMAEKLNIRLHDPLLLITQTDYDDNEQPIIYSIEYHLPDKTTFVIYRKGPDYE